jgi:hypothetical protein
MPDRYWVGGTANWDATAGTKWAATSGGAGGQTVPTSVDSVFFTAASGTVTVTITAAASCLNLTCTGFTGTITGSNTLAINGSCTLVAGMTWSFSGVTSFPAASGSFTVTSGGKTFNNNVIFGAAAAGTATRTLQDALTVTGTLTVNNGTFTTNNFSVTATSLTSPGTQTRTINFGSSSVTLGSITFPASGTLTFNAGTSTVTINGSAGTFDMNFTSGRTFYDVVFAAVTNSVAISGNNTFRNLTIQGRTTSGVKNVSLSGFSNNNQTITGTLTFSAGTNATCRTVLAIQVGTTTLTCAAVSATDVDFGRITIAGAAAPASGTRLGNRLGNSGITFPAAKTVHWNLAGGGNWGGAIGWATSSGGAPAINNFPLPQDTAIIENTGLNTGATITFNDTYAFTTINMSARTNAMTFAATIGILVLGNWTNGTGVSFTGAGSINFRGGGTSTITSAGRTFTQQVVTANVTSISLQDSFITSFSSTFSAAFEQSSATLTLNNFNLTLTGAQSRFTMGVAVLVMGSGTLTVAGEGGFNAGSNSSIVSGTGTISLTSATAKSFEGQGIQTYPTINQGGTGALTITGSNKFAAITNTAVGSVLFTGGTTNEFTAFSLNGTSTAARLTLGSTNTTQVTLRKPSSWNVGAGSLDNGNNTGLSFTAGGNDFLAISYVVGVNTAPGSFSGNFLAFF